MNRRTVVMHLLALWVRCRAPFLLACVSLMVPVSLGCGRRVTLIPVTGRVTFDGSPVAGASVLVQPPAGPAARGMTDGDGRFVLGTYGERDGVILGPAAVSISCYERATQADADAGEPPLGKNLLPDKYANTSTSGLRAVIEPGVEPLDFQLSSE